MSLLDKIICQPFEALEGDKLPDLSNELYLNPDEYPFPKNFEVEPGLSKFKEALLEGGVKKQVKDIFDELGCIHKQTYPPEAEFTGYTDGDVNKYMDRAARILFNLFHFSVLFETRYNLKSLSEDLTNMIGLTHDHPKLSRVAGNRILQKINHASSLDYHNVLDLLVLDFCALRRGVSLATLASKNELKAADLAMGLLRDIEPAAKHQRGRPTKMGLYYLIRELCWGFPDLGGLLMDYKDGRQNASVVKGRWEAIRTLICYCATVFQDIANKNGMNSVEVLKLLGKMEDNDFESIRKIIRKNIIPTLNTSEKIDYLLLNNTTKKRTLTSAKDFGFNFDLWFPLSYAIWKHYPKSNRALRWMSKTLYNKFCAYIRYHDKLNYNGIEVSKISYWSRNAHLWVYDKLLVLVFLFCGKPLSIFNGLDRVIDGPSKPIT